MKPRTFRLPIALLAGALLWSAEAAARPVLRGQTAGAQPSLQERLKRAGADLVSRPDRTADVIQELKAILGADPGSVEAHFLLGIAYGKLGSTEMLGESMAELRQALALNPAFVQARYYLAQVYLDLGRAARAREELEAALKQVPGHPQFLALLGEAERQLGNPQRSVEVNRQALQANDSFAQARYYLSLALLDLGRRGEAIQELEKVVQSGPELPEVYLSLGTAYLEAGRVDDAAKVLVRGTQLDSTRPDIHVRLARAYRLKGRLKAAGEQLALASPTSAAGTSPLYQQVEFEIRVEEGQLAKAQGRLEPAAAAFTKALEIEPDHGPTLRDLAEVYLLQGSYALAAKQAARAAKLGFPLPAAERALLQQKLRAKQGRTNE